MIFLLQSIYYNRLNLYLFWGDRQLHAMGQTDTHTDIATTRLNQPQGPFSENLHHMGDPSLSRSVPIIANQEK